MRLDTSYIIIEGTDRFHDLHQAMVAGARDYLLAPLDIPALEKSIRNILRQKEMPVPSTRFPISGNDPILQQPASTYSAPVISVLNIIHRHYGENLTLAGVAEDLHHNAKYLGRLFRKETNMKFSEYLLAYRMYEARYLLETTSEKISYIALKTGFPLANNFYSYFKHFYGISPGDVRKQRYPAGEPYPAK